MKTLNYCVQKTFDEDQYPISKVPMDMRFIPMDGLYDLLEIDDAFRYHAEQEAIFFQRTGYCILRDRRGGTVKPLTLLELEKRILANDLAGLQEFRSTCGCMVPGPEDDYLTEH